MLVELTDIIGEALNKEEYCDYLNSLIPAKYGFDCTYAVDSGELAGGTLLYAREDGTVFSTGVNYEEEERDTWYSRLEECEEEDAECLEDGEEPDFWNIPEEPEYDMAEPETTFTFTDEWRPIDGLCEGTFINPKKQLIEIVRSKNPYCADIALKVKNPGLLLMQPELEQLKKAGYLFADNILQNGIVDYKEKGLLRAVLTRGSDLKHIFRVDKNVYKLLKEEKDLSIWTLYSYLYRSGKFTRENIAYCVKNGFSWNEISTLDTVLHYGTSFTKAVHYIERAVKEDLLHYKDRETCLDDFKDSLKMSKELDMKYNFGRYNLREQHDRLSALIRERNQGNLNEGFRQHYEEWKAFAKKDETFFIRPIKDQDELNKEAAEQNNCVASYAKDIAGKDSAIFIMRKNERPDESYATVEIDPYTGTIRQAYLGENEPIEDKDASAFLDRWEKFVQKKLEAGNRKGAK